LRQFFGGVNALPSPDVLYLNQSHPRRTASAAGQKKIQPDRRRRKTTAVRAALNNAFFIYFCIRFIFYPEIPPRKTTNEKSNINPFF